jgi:uncharacterized protein YabN with tetrapyrrole methylase and pyrophosphatase domain
MNDLFITAARKKYRFDSNKGALTVEQLFDLPLTSKSGFDLDSVAKATNKQLKEQTEDSFVLVSVNPLKGELSDKLEIVKAVISIRQAENEAARLQAERAAQRQRLRAAIDEAKTRQLSQASVEDLERQLAELAA